MTRQENLYRQALAIAEEYDLDIADLASKTREEQVKIITTRLLARLKELRAEIESIEAKRELAKVAA